MPAGDFNLWSDIDILIIGDFSGNILNRIKNIGFSTDMK